MSLLVHEPGLQTTIQAASRRSLRHLGVPSSGAADALSLALANRLLGNPWSAPALEATLQGPLLEFGCDTCVAVTGGEVALEINGKPVACHGNLAISAGDRLAIGRITGGARTYIGIAGGVHGERVLGSESTYLPAAFGGFEGRALRAGDRLTLQPRAGDCATLATPAEYRPRYTGAYVLRACEGAEADLLDESSLALLFTQNWQVSVRADRMGVALEGATLEVASDGRMASAPVFPGTVQCPESGTPYLLGVDAQTTGGYPRVLQVIRADRHLVGQLRPGDHVRFVQCAPAEAARLLQQKHAELASWLPDIVQVI